MSTAYPDRIGFVYILSNPNLRSSSDPSRPILKIGATRKHPVQRARELAAGTGVPVKFELAYYRDFSDCFAAETLIHQKLAEYRVNESREFFDLPIDEAIRVVDSAALPTRLADGRFAPAGGAAVESANLTGGASTSEDQEVRALWANVASMPLPWSELFSSFRESTDPHLNATEMRQCRELAARLNQQRTG